MKRFAGMFGILGLLVVMVVLPVLLLQPAAASPENYQPGNPYIHKFGENHDVDTAAAEDIWDYGGDYPWPTAATTTTIVSDDGDDAAGDTGARTVTVEGLDGNYLRLSETATLTGTNPVTLSGQYLRLYRAYVATAGSSGTNEGTIQIKHGSTVIAQISAEVGQTLMSIYTVPANYERAELCRSYANVEHFTGVSTSVADLSLLARPVGGAWQTKDVATIKSGTEPWDYDYGDCINFDPKTDIRWRAMSVSANDTAIIATFDLRLVP